MMILSKSDLMEYLEADKKALGRKNKKPSVFDLVWQYQISLRKNEYLINIKNGGVGCSKNY